MLTIHSLATVPAALLLLLANFSAYSSSADAKPWSSPQAPSADWEARVKGYPRPQIREDQQRPVAIRKMGEDENEMFFPHYWQFEATVDNMKDDTRLSDRLPALRSNRGEDYLAGITNASIAQRLQAPFALHTEQQLGKHPLLGLLPRALFPLRERQSGCPTNTADCSPIGASDSCCPTGDVCQNITDTGKGNVGCCAEGVDCNSDEVSDCQEGYQSCPDSLGGGCCIPGYTCVGSVCLQASTTTVLVNPTVIASPTTSDTSFFNASSKIPFSTTTTFVPAIIPTASTTPSSATLTPAPSSSTPSPTPESSPTSTSDIANAPVRPTSAATSTVTTTSDTTCPTGFYMCLAYYHGGCCRVGRDCALSDCPSSASTTIATMNGVTIVAPTGNGIGAATAGLGKGSCATGWTSCAASLDGGCCPGGYGCAAGTSCTATVAGESPTVGAKQAANHGGNTAAPGLGSGIVVMLGLTIGLMV